MWQKALPRTFPNLYLTSGLTFPLKGGNFRRANPTLSLFLNLNPHSPRIRLRLPGSGAFPGRNGPKYPEGGTRDEQNRPPLDIRPPGGIPPHSASILMLSLTPLVFQSAKKNHSHMSPEMCKILGPGGGLLKKGQKNPEISFKTCTRAHQGPQRSRR